MASMTEVPPKDKLYAITVTEAEKEVIAKALLIYRNVNYFCDNEPRGVIREKFVGQTSHAGTITALAIIQAIRSE